MTTKWFHSEDLARKYSEHMWRLWQWRSQAPAAHSECQLHQTSVTRSMLMDRGGKSSINHAQTAIYMYNTPRNTLYMQKQFFMNHNYIRVRELACQSLYVILPYQRSTYIPRYLFFMYHTCSTLYM